MGTTVQVRLDDETTAALREFSKRTGMSASQILRKGVHLAMKEEQLPLSARIVGIGEFDFGPTNVSKDMRRLMRGFGLKSVPAAKPRRRKSAR